MANEQCLPASNIRPTGAQIDGQADNIPNNEFIRFAYGTVSGGPYTNFTPNVSGANALAQPIVAGLTGLENGATYYYVVQHLAADGETVIEQSVAECSFTTTASFNPECELVDINGQTGVAILRVRADLVPLESQLEIVWGTVAGGPYPNVLCSVPGDETVDQTLECEFNNIPPCQTVYFAARVNNIPAEYIADWQYAHMNRINTVNETATLRLGDQADYPANQSVVDVSVANDQGNWHLRSGTFPIPSGVDNLHMGFTGSGADPNLGNYLDSCSIILRTAGGTILGEQLVNGSFEVPSVAPGVRAGCQVVPDGGFAWLPETTPGIAWQTTANDGLIEIWDGPSDFDCQYGQTNLPISAHTGEQWAELSATQQSELFQVVPLDKKNELSGECFFVGTEVECFPADPVGATEATLNGSACGIYAGTATRFVYGKEPGYPYTHATPLVFHTGVSSQILVEAVVVLECDTTYFYRVEAYDVRDPEANLDDPISVSDECSLTTEPCVYWCGGIWEDGECIPVDPGNGQPYLNCWPQPIRDGFPGEGIEHA